jgi:hypothetical protein
MLVKYVEDSKCWKMFLVTMILSNYILSKFNKNFNFHQQSLLVVVGSVEKKKKKKKISNPKLDCKTLKKFPQMRVYHAPLGERGLLIHGNPNGHTN